MIAAVYATLTILLAPISYGMVQVRVAEMLMVLPYFMPAAVPGLFAGCLIANIFGCFRQSGHTVVGLPGDENKKQVSGAPAARFGQCCYRRSDFAPGT